MTAGIRLAHGYYQGVVAPLLCARGPRLPHAAARLGSGSDVRFATTWDPTIRQRVQVATAEEFVASRLGLDVSGTLRFAWGKICRFSDVLVTAATTSVAG